MDTMHPVMRQALAACLPPGFRQAPVMNAVQQLQARIDAMGAALRRLNAPPCPAGEFEHTYMHPELGELECHLEHERAEPEAGWVEEVTLMTAYLCGRDITDRLTKDEVERIQIAAQTKAKAKEPA